MLSEKQRNLNRSQNDLNSVNKKEHENNKKFNAVYVCFVIYCQIYCRLMDRLYLIVPKLIINKVTAKQETKNKK